MRLKVATVAAAALLSLDAGGSAAELKVLSAGAVQPGLNAAAKIFRDKTGDQAKITYEPATDLGKRVAGGEIAEPLRPAVAEHGDDPDRIKEREEVDDPHQVTDRCLPKGERLPVVAHRAQAHRSFSQRLPVHGGFADEEVAREQDERQDQLHQRADLGRSEDTAERTGADGDDDLDARNDQDVDELRQETATDAGDLVLERDPFRGGDHQVI